MTDWDVLLAELSKMRGRLDQIAAVVIAQKTAEELMPVYSCGHRHITRADAIRCKSSVIEEDGA
jgi:hypothetical protein